MLIETYTLILSALFLFFFLVSLFYFLYFYSRLAFIGQSVPASNGQLLPVTVIICAQNENDNLKRFLPAILNQDYPEFEVIVVDDGSSDDTRFTLQEFQLQHPMLRIIELSEMVKNKQGKKFALMMGIKGAKYDHVLLSDADCEPVSDQWIRLMQAGFSEEKSIVLGYSPYLKQNGFLNLFIRYETFLTASNYFSYALAGLPYMGVGRNLAYNKRLFFESKGFSSHIHLMSGDDDLFINKVATAVNTSIVIGEPAFTLSEPKQNYSDFFRQKMRHTSVGHFYRKIHKNLLTLNAVGTIGFYLCFVLLLAFRFHPEWVLGIFAFRLLLQLVLFIRISGKLGSSELGILSPLMDIAYHIYLVFISIASIFYKQKTWK